MRFSDMVAAEIASARTNHKNINSFHEGYAIILEELDEVWEEVRKRSSERSNDRTLKELVQVAAMCQRTAEDLRLIPECDRQIGFRADA